MPMRNHAATLAACRKLQQQLDAVLHQLRGAQYRHPFEMDIKDPAIRDIYTVTINGPEEFDALINSILVEGADGREVLANLQEQLNYTHDVLKEQLEYAQSVNRQLPQGWLVSDCTL